MAKNKDYVVHVQSSTFKELLTTQTATLGTLKSMKEIMEGLQDMKVIGAKPAAPEVNPEVKKLEEENIKLKKKLIGLQKEEVDNLKHRLKLQDEEAEAIKNIAKGMKVFHSPLEKFRMGINKLTTSFTEGGGIRGALLKSFNIGGIFNKSIEREKFIKTQKMLGSEKTREELKADFKGAQATRKEIDKNEEKIKSFQKMTGLSESEMAKTKGGRELLDKRKAQAEQFAKFDERAKLVRQTEEVKPIKKPALGSPLVKTPTEQFAEDGKAEEQAIEDQKLMGEQTTLLTKIEENTRGASPDQKAKPEEGKGGGLLGKLLGGGMGKALAGLKDFGVGIVLVAGALWVASKAFKSFAEVAWEDIGKGLVVLGGLAVVARVLGNATGSLLKASVGLGALALVTWGASAAFKEFADLDWETIGKGFLTIIGLGAVGVVLGSFAAPALLGAAALGALGAAVWVVGKGFQEMGDAFNLFVDGIERLSNIGFEGLAGVAGGMTLLGGAMVAFAAGNAAAGISNLVTGFLSAVTGQKTPVEQLVEIGNAGEGINKAGSGMQRLAAGMKAFGDIKADSLKALKQFPWEEATKFVAAGGAMSADGAKVYNQSKANADEASQKSAGGGTTNTVVAPVTNVNNTQVQQMRPAIRNYDPWHGRKPQSPYAINNNW
jgi:hypothetical protein